MVERLGGPWRLYGVEAQNNEASDIKEIAQQGQKLARFTVRFFDWLLPAGHSNCQRLAHTLLDGERM